MYNRLRKYINTKNIIIVLICILALFITIFIVRNKENNNILVESNTIVIKPNEIKNIRAMLHGSNDKIDITILDDSVAMITEEQYVKGLSIGKTKVMLKANDCSREIDLIVSNEMVEVESIEILDIEKELKINDTYLYEVKFFPEISYENELEWTSSNENVAKVNDGIVTVIGNGKATIRVLTSNQKESSIELNISNSKVNPLKAIHFNEENINLTINSSYQLEPIFVPSNVTNKNITYTIENDNIISINNNKIIAKNEGVTKIIASLDNVTREIFVNVKSNIQKEKIAINETKKLIPQNKNIIDWYSNNERIVAVNDGIIKGISGGTATVTAINSSNKLENFEITVRGAGLLATSIVTKEKDLHMIVGTNHQLSSYVMPKNAINKDII